MWVCTYFEIVLRKYDTKEQCYHQCEVWFALQDWQVWKCWEMEAVLFLWSHSTFSAVFPLRIFTGVRNKVSPTICTVNFTVGDCYGQYCRLNFTVGDCYGQYHWLNFTVGDCYGQYRRLNFFYFFICYIFFLISSTLWICVLARACVRVHNGVGLHFWGTGTYELDCDIPDGRIVLCPSCVPEKVSVNQKGVNKKWHSHNK
jgi:hypothetical protein